MHIPRRSGSRRGPLLGAIAAACALLGARAWAGDYHAGLTLRCNECHVMHFSQSHGYQSSGFVGTTPLGGGGPYRALLRNRVNDLCLACHDGNIVATDVLGDVNSGSQGGIVRNGGYLSSLVLGGTINGGHTLESLDNAPGSQPPWNALSENSFGEGLMCINCHDPHGAPGNGHPSGSQYRNLRSDAGYSVGSFITYNHENPGVLDITRDVFVRQSAAYDETQVDWNEPNPNDSALARWCGSCHTEMHGNALGGGGGGGSGGLEHPVWGEDLESDMLIRYNGHANRVKVMSEIGMWFPAGGDVTPTCMTCHRAHGNGNPRGLIFRSGTGIPTENGDSNGTSQADLCLQCHDSGNPD